MDQKLISLVKKYARILHPKLVKRADISNLRFKCEDCSECCKGGHLLIVPEKDLQEKLKENLYPMPVTGLMVMKRVNNSCPYLEGRSCSVQDSKPLACRGYPIFLDPYTQEIYVDMKCPGVGEGNILAHDLEDEMITARRKYWGAMHLSDDERRIISEMLIIPNVSKRE